MPRQTSLLPDEDNYFALLNELKSRIRSAQIKAAIAVNRELVLLYWHIGQEILMRQQQEGQGSKVIDRLFKELRQEFRAIKGFSSRNLEYIGSFSHSLPKKQLVLQAVAQVLLSHNLIKVK
ncbi:MAG: DUF1016 domain-containing protein [Leptolyngbya sp. SIO4C5]|nr:DUF1016 domain-containing protein [Leptolyngbya sp. SIO4C5]